MDNGKIRLIELVMYETEQRMGEDGTMFDEDLKYVDALRSAVKLFFNRFGYYYWGDATVEKQQPEQLDNGGTQYVFILTSDKQQIPQKRFSFII